MVDKEKIKKDPEWTLKKIADELSITRVGLRKKILNNRFTVEEARILDNLGFWKTGENKNLL